ncbi:MAG: hypothetical protein JSR58_05935 [Verrucomicrobia bacterium]|nr:hypothetical protein [Verrucomicrobiota bacterium]
MKVGILSRYGEKVKWGGDTKVLVSLQKGLRKLGCQADFVEDPTDFAAYDMALLSNTCLDLRPVYHFLRLHQIPYALMGFHEDMTLYAQASSGFFRYVQGMLSDESDEGYPFSLERLLENPRLIFYYSSPPRKMIMANYDIIKNASVCFANTLTEVQNYQKDCPGCNTFLAPLPPGFAEGKCAPGDDFLRMTGLNSGEYILQIGRLELRKNQLGTILATADLPMPLVFISTLSATFEYEKCCLEAIYKYRKDPTFVISQTLPSMKSGPLHILQMPGKKKLSRSMLLSALYHAGLHLHPAFYELPGLTYLEAAKLGTPSIASSWTTVGDYFDTLDDRLVYTLPYDLPNIKKLISQQFGKRYPQIRHPVFTRTSFDYAQNIHSAMMQFHGIKAEK